MFKSIAATLLVASGMLCASSTALAQYVGPTHKSIYGSVADVLKNPIKDVRVTLRGKILSRLSHDRYEFSDGTGTIMVEIDDEDFAGQRVDDKTTVEIWGEVDKDLLRPAEIDVKRLTVIQ